MKRYPDPRSYSNRESFNLEAVKVRDQNIQTILIGHKLRTNEIKRSGHKLRIWTCPFVAAVFVLMAWYSFSHPGIDGMITGVLYSVGALAFLAMLVLGAIFDKPLA